jgi:hypothetical protein
MIKNLVIVVLIIVILGMRGVSIQHDIVENPGVQENTSYVATGATNFWNTYLSGPAHFIWQRVIVDILWEGFRTNMERLRNGQSPTDFHSMDTSAVPNIPHLIDQYNQNHPTGN